ncbi:MAG: amidohydrolase family protein [Erysipelotrichaceae bacterium]|nr:amidohydrolase family protein [Erysipelotrichaceae bacterium]
MKQYVLKPKYIKVGGLIDVVKKTVTEGVALIVEEEVITRIEPIGKPDPKKYRIYDYTKKFVIPGLINTHVHLFNLENRSLQQYNELSVVEKVFHASEILTQYLDQGVTYIRTVGCNGTLDIDIKRAIAKGLMEGPEIMAAGPALCITGGDSWKWSIEADGVDAVRHETRKLIKRGADVIKVIGSGGVLTKDSNPNVAQYTVEELRTIVEEAHMAGLKVACHAFGSQAVLNAVAAGVDSVEHGVYMCEDGAKALAKNHIYLVPTLVCESNIAKSNKKARMLGIELAHAPSLHEEHLKSIQRAIEYGVTLAAGTDSGSPLTGHDVLVDELKMYNACGLDPIDALATATINAANCLGIGDQYGSIEVGKIADLVILNKNPLKDLAAITSIHAVFKKGKRVRS